MLRRELGAVDERPEQVFHPPAALVAPGTLEARLEVGRHFWIGPSRQDGQEGRLDGGAIVGRLPADARGGVGELLLGVLDHQVTVLKRVKLNIKKRPSDYLRGIHLDAVNALPAVIRFGIDLVGPERMLYSSDHPWVQPQLIIDNVRSLKLPAEQEAMIFHGNARRLFNL